MSVAVIYSGIDWSGDPGDSRKSVLPPLPILAICHVRGEDLVALTVALDRVRTDHGLSPSFAFRFANCADKVRQAFFRSVATVPVQSRVLVVDKRLWSDGDLRLRGPDRLNRCLADLVCRCPPGVIAGQVLMVDLPKAENSVIAAQRAAINSGLRGLNVAPLPKIKACPDHRLQGVIVQVADMVAGAIQRDGGEIGPSIGPLRRMIELV